MKERKKDSNKSEEKARIGFFAGFQLRCKNPTNNEATKLEKHVLEKKWTFANEEIERNGNEKKGEKRKVCVVTTNDEIANWPFLSSC